jgi:hypothetical protein
LQSLPRAPSPRIKRDNLVSQPSRAGRSTFAALDNDLASIEAFVLIYLSDPVKAPGRSIEPIPQKYDSEIALDQNSWDVQRLKCAPVNKGIACSRCAYTAGAVRAS